MKPLNSKTLKKFLILSGDKLEGRWLLVGGTLLPAVGLDIRSTVDIDLIGLGEGELKQALSLMDIAESLGLSVETINQAAAYFLNKIKYDKKDLLLLHQGKRAKIFRPSAELYLKLKISRLSESDLLDCKYYLNYCSSVGDLINRALLKSLVKDAMKNQTSFEKSQHLKSLEEFLEDLN